MPIPLLTEGCRATPWFREKSRRGELAISDCNKCKAQTSQPIRAAMGCGYESRADGVHLTVWQPPQGKNGYSGPALTTCAGYTCNLPVVVEATKARAHWSAGNVAYDRTPEDLLDAILIIDGQVNQLQAWLMTPASDGGGGS